ncbi:MAG: hypothetical protein IT331_22485 [Anaerolineae bacterium]|nr:hypothetical protein [Anaerolineae bacterium]
MRTNTVREKLRSGKPVIGCFMGLGSPTVAEMLAHAGFDYLVIETEHNGLDSAEIQEMLMAMNGADAIPFVRIPSANPVFIQRALDIGALGIVVPLVRTAAEAEAIVRATRYPPQGTRSFGGLRASHFTFDNYDYFYRANDNLMVTLILETREAVENINEIAAVPGIDVLMFGYYDLCLSYGLDPMKQPYPQIDAITAQVMKVGKKAGVAIGAGANTPDGVNKLLSDGVHFVSYGPDYALIANAVRPGIARFRELTA